MKLLSTKQTETNLYELEVQVEEGEFAAGLEKSYKKNAPKLNIPGFRKGKAPKAMVMKMAGEEYFYNDAINETCYDAYEAAVKEAGLTPVARPDVEIGEVGHDGYTFTAKVTNKPEAEIEDYMGLEVERSFVDVSDAEIDEELKHTAERNSRLVAITDRPAENGDTAEIDFEGFVDGKAFKGGKGENYALVLGSGSFIPGFEEQVAGHSTGDSFDVDVTFPEGYQAKKLAGKPAVFKVTINAIKKKEVPAIDDEFAKDVSEHDTLAEYKEELKQTILDRKNKLADNQLDQNILNAVTKKVKADIPAAMIQSKIDEMITDMDYRMRMQGVKLEDYMKYTGMTMDKLREEYVEPATQQIRSSLALDGIMVKEKIEATADEIEAELKKTAESYKMELEKVKELVNSEDVAERIRGNKAIAFLKEHAKIVQKTVEDGADKAEDAAEADDADSVPAEKPKKVTVKKAAKTDVADGEEKPKKKAPAKKKAEDAAE